MLRKDAKARFVPAGVFGTKRQFSSGKLLGTALFPKKEMAEIMELQTRGPVPIAEDGQTRRKWWLFEGVFYWEDEGYTAKEVKALLLDRKLQRDKKVQRAIARTSQAATAPPTAGRKPIPDDVKVLVWNRDGGRCVSCGSQKNLEYDHIIPVSKGGSNTARNLQLLCETCNRSKGGNIA